jgi:hypothetical protein
MPLKTLLIGFGPLGENLAKHLEFDKRFNLKAIIDNDPSKSGLDFAGLKISQDLQSLLETESFDLAFIVTSSFYEQIEDLIFLLAQHKVNIVSSCEQLIFPEPKVQDKLNQLAKKHSVFILGTGINPGFLMDYFLTVLSMPFVNIRELDFFRSINTDFRRDSFKAKVGVGLSLPEFNEQKEKNKIGHVGFEQSADLLLQYFAWQKKHSQETIEPVLVNSRVQGIKQSFSLHCAADKKINFNFLAYKANEDFDSIKIFFTEQQEPLEIKINNGINGENATVAMLMNTAVKLSSHEAGFKTMLDL